MSPTAAVVFDDREILRRALALLARGGRDADASLAACRRLQSDGSMRRFWRLPLPSGEGVVIIAPATATVAELAEARAAWRIGSHLQRQGVAVPELYGWDEESGTLCCEDLGDVRLQEAVVGRGEEELLHWYELVLAGLVDMQLGGALGFDAGWCWDSPRYDRALMLQRESGYFLRAFWQDLLGREPLAGIDEEFAALADRAGQAPCEAFLHRDFQSRNIMVQGGRVRFIDFQGGRFGPLGYDVASLLLDPYAGLSPGLQEQLLGTYCRLVESRQNGGGALAASSYPWLALQRNLQIVGAFAFLWKVRNKPFFAAYLRPALASLHERLRHDAGADFPLLRSMARQGLAAVENVAG